MDSTPVEPTTQLEVLKITRHLWFTVSNVFELLIFMN